MELNRFGFITNYLVAGPHIEDVADEHYDENQLNYEKYLRSAIVDTALDAPEGEICAGEKSRIGEDWHYHYCGGNHFVDYSTFYFTLKKVRLEAATVLISAQKCKVGLRLWTYCTVNVWCNGRRVLFQHPSVYKPMMYKDAVLDLDAGENLLYVSLQTLGARDTRTIFGLEITGEGDGLEVSLPDIGNLDSEMKAEEFLNGTAIDSDYLRFPYPAPDEADIWLDNGAEDYAKRDFKYDIVNIAGRTGFAIPEKYRTVILKVGGLSRSFSPLSHFKPEYGADTTQAESLRAYLELIAGFESSNRHNDYGFAMPNVLARKVIGMPLEKDDELFEESLEQIDKRLDCSDFLLVCLIRYIREFGYPSEKLEKKCRNVLSNFRYWMTFEGSDAMCFWSENHALQFYSSMYMVGLLFPELYFKRAKMTGRELCSFGRSLLEQWLDDVDEHGFEEFSSACYMCMTGACLINLIDYSEAEIAAKAKCIMDKMVVTLSRHTFKGSLISPMGRIYSNVVMPFTQGVQTLINLIDPSAPKSNAEEPWLSVFATTSYRFPAQAVELMKRPLDISYTTGNALVRLKKTENYVLSSVQSPRTDEGYEHLPNLTFISSCDKSGHQYVKSLNERFHGTTNFNPGVFGYQQHMWVAGLDNDTVVFTTHPGGTFQSTTMRPGYWYGNGVMPAIRQDGNTIAVIYSIPDCHPVKFTHLYLPMEKFDEIRIEPHWVFGRKGKGLIAVYSSGILEKYEDELSNSEFRVYDCDNAYCSILGEEQSFCEFVSECKSLSLCFDREKKQLIRNGETILAYQSFDDETQYL